MGKGVGWMFLGLGTDLGVNAFTNRGALKGYGSVVNSVPSDK
jgi:hypothetical protein